MSGVSVAFGKSECRLCLLNLRLVIAWIDDGQQLARFDKSAVFHRHLLNDARHAGGHIADVAVYLRVISGDMAASAE